MKTRPHFLVPIALALTTVFLTGGVSGLIAADKPDSAKIERLTGRPMRWSYNEASRAGDHIWYISDVRRFRSHYPAWVPAYPLDRILGELHGEMSSRPMHVGQS